MRRLVAGLALVLAVVVATSRPAAAHNVGSTSASNFLTTIFSLQPNLPGVSVRVIEGGSRLELTNSSGIDVTIVGYSGEPYLRVGSAGVFENALAPTTFLNRTRDGQSPTGGSASAPPEWHRVSSSTTARWFDHRTHWMSDRLPREVESSPGRPHVIEAAWKVPLRHGETSAQIVGSLTWQPGPSPLAWYMAALAIGMATAATGLMRRWWLVMSAWIVVLLACDLAHTFGVAFAVGGSTTTHLATVFTGSFYAFVGWALALVAVRLLRRRSVDGLYAAVFAALSMGIFGGVLDLAALSHSVIPFALPLWIGRASVALSLGLGAGLTLASVLVIRRTPEARTPIEATI